MFKGADAGKFSLDGSTGVLSVGATALATTQGTTYTLTLTATGETSASSGAITLTITSAAECSNIPTLLLYHH